MKIILSARGLAALGWLSAFAYLWAFALGFVPGNWTAAGILGLSFLAAMMGAAVIASEDKQTGHVNRKANPPSWSDPGKPGGDSKP